MNFTEKMHQIGNNIAYARKLRGFSLEYLANEIEAGVSHLRRIEHGKANATISTLCRIALGLKIDVDHILTGDLPAKPLTDWMKD